MIPFLLNIIRFLHAHQIDYMLSGSVAMSQYVTPRATRDLDFVIHLKPEDARLMIRHFAHDHYCDEDAVLEAIRHRTMFNIIDYASGYKADFMLLKSEPFRQTEFNRRRQISIEGTKMYIVSPEDLWLSKLIWIQDYQSNLQKEDIRNLSTINSLDWQYIGEWITALKLNTFDLLEN